MYVGEALNVCYEEYKKEGEEIVFVCVIAPRAQERAKRSERSARGGGYQVKKGVRHQCG